MQYLILIPFIVQALVFGFDEAYFHIRRGLPLWERIGHPIDTLTLLLCLAFVFFFPYSLANLKWYMALAILSCLTVTKDEWVHKHVCPASENWTHAILFVNHPILLSSIGFIWVANAPLAPAWIKHWLTDPIQLYNVLMLQTGFATLIFLYQIIYWNFIWKEKKHPQ